MAESDDKYLDKFTEILLKGKFNIKEDESYDINFDPSLIKLFEYNLDLKIKLALENSKNKSKEIMKLREENNNFKNIEKEIFNIFKEILIIMKDLFIKYNPDKNIKSFNFNSFNKIIFKEINDRKQEIIEDIIDELLLEEVMYIKNIPTDLTEYITNYVESFIGELYKMLI